MFVAEAVTMLVKGFRDTFHAGYPEPDFRELHVSHEYPIERQDYPGVWVDMNITSLRTAGLDHREQLWVEASEGFAAGYREVQRYRFTGMVQYTVATLTSLERARLFDEAVKVLAFSGIDPTRSTFRSAIEDNPLIALSMDFDDIATGGFAATPGTPWGTNDIIYEATLSQDIAGEFVSDPAGDALVPLAGVEVLPYREGEPVPEGAGTPGGWV